MNNKSGFIVKVIACVVVIALLMFGLTLRSCGNHGTRGVVWDNTGTVDTESPATYVSIAGFDRVAFTPMEITQKVSIYNPKNNTCMMSFIMYIEGEEVWAADDIQAGHGFTEIKLSKVYETGNYSGLMEIKCYDPDSGKRMNGASFEFNVIVR